ncbi:MAG: DNA polymerase III subunit gamma/tau [Bacilli bacterium]|nr:DNA polymerase III subunit gamma/tau [Bacilli bacterium]
MNYKVLYRKYRPSTFDEVVGQDNTITLLKDSILNEKISHAYIFSGPRGTGKTSCAKIFAKAINCLNPKNGNPCGKCENCLNFATSNDIYEIDAASNNGVDQVREIIENIKLTPINLKYKVYIVDEVHMLSISAFNALLLTLEEPPKHAVFILATTDIEDVPITVLSRCQRLDFRKIRDVDIEKNIKDICKKEDIDIDKDAISEIASFADGGMRDALSILDQLSKTNEKITQDVVLNSIGVISNKKIKELIDAYSNNDINAIEEFIASLRETSVDFKSLIKKIIKQLRLSALEIINTNGDLNLFEKYKKLSFDLASLIYKNNVNIDVLTLLEFTLLPVENNNMLTLTNPSKNEVESKSPNTEIETIETNVIESKKNSDKLTHDNAGENDEKAKNKEIKLTPDNREENSDNLSLIDIRVNNCFVKASKNYLNSIKESWQTYLDKLTRKKLKGLLLDLDVVLASDQYVVLKSSFENTVKEVNNSLIVIEESFNKITDLDYRFIAISDELWGKKTEEYKQNIRNNVVYTLMSEPDNNGDTGLLNDVFNDIKIEVQ